MKLLPCMLSCECDSFRGVPNCRGSLMNCVGLVECVLSLISRVDVSPECALRRVVRAVLPSVHSDVFCIFIVINMHIVYDMYEFVYCILPVYEFVISCSA